MTPPRVARWLLDRAVPGGPEGDTIRGDLLEEFAARAAASRLGARLWYWRAALSMLFRYAPAPMVRGVGQDLRFAARRLGKAPAFTAVVLATLGLGIGANTAIFSALNAVLLRPLPYPDAHRLVGLVTYNPSMGIRSSNVSAADFLDWQRDAHAFESLGVFTTFSMSMSGTNGADAERIGAALQTNLFTVLGVAPSAGRDFTGSDAHEGPATAAIVSHGLWQRRFGADASTVGRPLRPGRPAALVGVMPRGFAYPNRTEVWLPAVLDPVADPRTNRMFEAIGRLRKGVTVRQAQAELDAISSRLEAAYPSSNRGMRVRVVPLTDYVVGDARATLLLLLGAVGLVLLVACANVANLFLAQASARRREIAVRAAIGAGRGRIVRQVLTESVLLSTIAGAIGILIGRWGLQLLIAIGGRGIPRLEEATLDRTVLLFSAAVSIGTGLLFGLLPAVHLSRSNLVQALREGARGGGSRSRTRKALVVAEVAIALVLLVAAGLTGRSFQGLQRVDVGFDPDRLLTMRVSLSGPKYAEPQAGAAYYTDAVRRISAVPGVRSASAVLALPVGGGGFYLGRGFIRPGREHPAEGYNASYRTVLPRYFATLGVPLLKGRDFDEHDTAASPWVTVINRTLAERFFPGENPIGQKVLVWRDENTPREIVGIAGDLKTNDLTAAADPEMYVPHTQSTLGDMTLVVRTEGSPAAAASAVRAAVSATDPTQAVYDLRTFETIMRDTLAQQRFSLALFAGFAALALALAAVGLYGVMSSVVNGRAHEMGVRLALGARPSEVRGLIVRQALVLFAVGLLIGLPLSLAGARLLGKLLYGVGPGDPLTLLAVTAVLAGVAWLSAAIPAARATRIDPASALRAE